MRRSHRTRMMAPLAGLALLLATAATALAVPPPAAAQTAVPPIDPPTLRTNPDGDPYLIGAHVWPGFQQGTHTAGWRRLAHYPDREPLLGFYDQDRVEVWDWQIKFAVEHGLSYFAFLWDRGSESGQPVTHPLRGHALNAFKQSAFSNQMQYALIWNQLHGTTGLADFENNIWPHLQQEINDPGYLVVDNRPVIFINDQAGIGNAANVVARLRQLVLADGFSGAYVVTSRTKESYSDHSFYYANNLLDCGGNFDSACDQLAEQAILDRFDGTRIGTMSMGWDRDPSNHRQFHGVPGQMFNQRSWRFTTPGYADLAQEFRSAMDAGTGLVNRLALAGAWDEWVEGHYINPTRTDGYGYLEGIRNAFTLADNAPYHGDPLNEGFGPYDLNYTRDVAHYPLDQSSGGTATDTSGWGRHATLFGNPVWRPTGGTVGGALELDGLGDYLRLAPADPGSGPGFMHDFVGLRSVSMWVKLDTTAGTQVLFDQGGTAYGIGLRVRDGVLEGAIRKQPDTDLLAGWYPADGAWHHVALGYQGLDEDGTSDFYTRLYLDGVLVDEVRHAAEDGWRMIRANQDPAAVGARASGDAFGEAPTGGYLDGLIDDVRIVPIELRPDEVAAIAGLPVRTVDSHSGGITYRSKGIVEGALYYWTESASAGDHQGSVKHTTVAANDALYTFTGDSVTYVARKGPFQAMVQVFLDGVSQGVFDLYAAQEQSQQVVLTANLAPGEHTIRIAHAGMKHPDSQGNLINVDYLAYTG